jgi:hypothetical protein
MGVEPRTAAVEAASCCAVPLENSASQRFNAMKAKRGNDRDTTNDKPSGCRAMKVRVVERRTLETS